MRFDPRYWGFQGFARDDKEYMGSRFAEVRRAVFANSYYLSWGAADEPPLPVYEVTLRRALTGVLRDGKRFPFQRASDRTVDSRADLRWGLDRRGFRRILHPNGVCLTGTWEIDAASPYTGYFAQGSRGLLIARYSSCCTETRRGRYRSLSMVGKLYPTIDRKHQEHLRPASFITQEDLGGSRSHDISDVELRTAPDVTPWRRGSALPVLLLTGLVLARTDKENTIRQLYEIAELGKLAGQETNAPEFMRLTVAPPATPAGGPDLDFRDEVLGRIYDKGNPTPQRPLIFQIDVSDSGYTRGRLVVRRTISNWKRLGRIVFTEAVASYNGDFVIHFPHPAWRDDRNNPATVRRRGGRRV
jgi:hypothetical protein